ncbi:Thymidylate Kinase [Epinotia aporema granulovirus]|uniref:dTMP kinase n=1 Tax=Epinotia aporema granulovirus TaxID=166056 RepID=K4ERU4_9BBAC|nr:Thymidylate Kinase [Epinotia aporema granulovirus]AER41490.1 Thymidylate Kinase [Epinotia aporema granulovirus]
MGFIVAFEGLDRSGKSSQVARLAQTWHGPTTTFKFPDRSTPTGQILNKHLTEGVEDCDEYIHLLFCANRWEQMKKINQLAAEESHLVIIDRYLYSGIAYSAAKGLDFDFCVNTNWGQAEPDLVFFMNYVPPSTRTGYGEEIYEREMFQRKVFEQYKKIATKTWVMLPEGTEEETWNNIWTQLNKRLLSHYLMSIILLGLCVPVVIRLPCIKSTFSSMSLHKVLL